MSQQCKHLSKDNGNVFCDWNNSIIMDHENCNKQICPEGYKEK